MQIKCISWNIWGGKNRDAVIEYLQDQDADVIGLQEVTSRTQEGVEYHDAQIIAKALGYSVYFSNAFTTDRHTPSYSIGNALLSKYPIESSKTIMLSDLTEYQKNSTTEPRNAVICTIVKDNIPITVISTHLGYSETLQETPLQRKQLTTLLSNIPTEKTILMGDFNSMPSSKIIASLEDTLQQTDTNLTEYSWTNHKKEDLPQSRIDYIFTTKDITTKKTLIGDTNASDHRPVIAELYLQ